MTNNYYIDMDGVLAKYGIYDYKGENPKFLHPNTHYFLNRQPDIRAVKLLQLLCTLKNSDVYILSSVVNNHLYDEYVDDKTAWVLKHCPEINPDTNLIITTMPKHKTVCAVNNIRKLATNRILIDDFNQNLISWQNAGGTAIKYCNGINNPSSYNGIILPEDLQAEELLQIIKTATQKGTMAT